MDPNVANDVYSRYGLEWANFPQPTPPSAHSDAAELFCARLSLAVYAVHPDTPHSPRHDYVPSKNREVLAAVPGIEALIEGGRSESPEEAAPEAPDQGFRTVVTDQAAAALIWKNDHLIIGFRGTANWQDWIHNLTGKPINTKTISQGDDYKLHKGFTGLAQNIFPTVAQQVHAHFLQRDRPGILTVCGHSLGGALALNFATQWREVHQQFRYYGDPGNVPAEVAATYTFGAPRIGTGNIWDFIERPHYRLRVTGDPVPALPRGFAEDYQATFLAKPGYLAEQPRTFPGKIIKAGAARLPRLGVDLKAHQIETYIEAIENKIDTAAAARR